MNTTWKGSKEGRVLFVFAALTAAACSRAAASREPAQPAPSAVGVAQASPQTTLEVADRDCADGASSGRGGSLDDLRAVSLERVPIHSRTASHATSAWRLAVASQRGPGAIVLVDLPRGDCYVGQGLFLGWTQGQLASAYVKLKPRPDPVPDDFQQLE